MPSPIRTAQAIGVATGGVAVTLATRAPALSALTADAGTGVPPWIVRLLGARYGLQAGLEVAKPTATSMRLACICDLLHAASMVAAAARWSQHRRAAISSAALASISALATSIVARKLPS